MESTAQRRIDAKTLVVSVLCILGAATSGVFLYLDMTASGRAGTGPSMAKVVRREAKVRRKPAATYIWSNVQTDEGLYRKDSLATAGESAAAVRFNDGSILELGENSLVVIDDITNLSLNFVRGSLVVRRSTGDSRITVGKDGKAKVEELQIRLVKPEPLALIFAPDKGTRQVRFAWDFRAGQSPDPNDSYAVEVSVTPDFKAGRTQRLTPAEPGAKEVEAKLASGKYYWRITGKAGALTDSGQFRVAPAFTLNPVWPTASQKMLTWGADAAVQFRWIAPAALNGDVQDEHAKHTIEIARDAEFKEVALTAPVASSAGTAELRKLPEGKLYWRIKSRYDDLTLASRVEPFIVEKAQQLGLEAGKPEEGESLPLPPEIRFSWSCDSRDVEFQWEVQSSAGKTVATTRVKTMAAVWKNPPAGLYKWRVQALWQNKPVGETPWRGFSVFSGQPVVLKAPLKDQQIYYWHEPQPFSFEWEEDATAEQSGRSYQVEVASDIELKNNPIAFKTTKLSASSEKMQVPPGTFFWRVRVVDAGGQVIKTSEPWKFSFGQHPPLRAPASAKPEMGAVFNPLESEKDPVASWAPVEGAEAYEVTVKSQDKILIQTVTTEATLELKGLKEGNYTWTVRAVDKLKRRGEPLDLKSFKVTYGEPLAAPEVTNPEVQ